MKPLDQMLILTKALTALFRSPRILPVEETRPGGRA